MPIGTFPLRVSGFPFAWHDEFPSSVPKPGLESRHLYTGHPMANQQAPAIVFLGRVCVSMSPDSFRCVVSGSLSGSSFFCVHISETKIFVHTMRRRAPCGAEGRIQRGRTWFV